MWLYYLSAGMGLVGAFLLFFAVKRFIQTVIFLRSAEQTEGKIVRFIESKNNDRLTMYLPVFDYQPALGKTYRQKAEVASNPPEYKIGEAVTILFMKKSPQNSRLKSFSELWLITAVLLLFGAAFTFAALLIFLAQK
ncbi:MAG: DUF3592 domain-containing protein [Pyrinomonadaceae bacterium]|nr:DUF3592 domain-containing protein [Pyrinomonadaceae bacterium]